jgi:myo-inositol-1(or 4)-monophosphatase
MIETLREVAAEVQKAVRPIKGTMESREVIKMGADGTPTMKMDDVAEMAAFDVLKGMDIPLVVLSEESGLVRMGDDPEYICVLDPVDGTHNAVRGIPFYSISIAIAPYRADASMNDIEFGLVMNLETGDVFEAELGKGARFNGERISTEDKRLDESTFCIYMRNDTEKLNRLLKGVKRIRNMGSVALELCHVAKGDYHGLVDLRNLLKVTDVAAGKLILEEAGGTSTPETSILSLKGIPVVACSSEKLYKDVAKLLRDEND